MRHPTILLTACLSVWASTAPGQDLPVAGTAPWERPAGAPVIAEMVKDAAWYALALTGVDQPYPASLRFLEDQGAWFSPFTHPGMTGPYDIRHWHGGE
ncbi:hypothetical protein ACDP63_23730 [Paracoccus sp. P2]|uniref:hypothetical protein n=1 Tax=Paracoccus sp. P2 TaxID=3248840 RepID=UPI00391F0777